MPIYRCNRCGLISEDLANPAGSKVPCTKCRTFSTLFSTTLYVEKLIERYLAMRRELEVFKQQEEDPAQELQPQSSLAMTPQPLLKDDLPNTNLLANEAQHKPLNDWFAWKQIEARFFYDSVDITGFFDEAAIAIGDAVRPTFKRYRTS